MVLIVNTILEEAEEHEKAGLLKRRSLKVFLGDIF